MPQARPIIKLPDPILRQTSHPVERVTDEIRALMEDMLETIKAENLVGLAANQVGEAVRVAVTYVAQEGEIPNACFMVNPELLWVSDELSLYKEGSPCIPGFFEDVERPARIRATYLDEQGQNQELEADGLLATCIQHEIDHLNGVLFIDHLSRLKRSRIISKFSKAAKRVV